MIEEIGRAQGMAAYEQGEVRSPQEIVEAGFAETIEEAKDLQRRSFEAIKDRKVKITMDHVVTAGIAAMNAELVAPVIEQMSWLVAHRPPPRTSSSPPITPWC